MCRTYTYDAWNRLASKSNSPLHYYQYDALGRLIREGELYWLMSDMYYNDRWQVVEDQRVQCRVGTIKSQYVWSVGFVDDMLLRDRNVDMAMVTGSYGKTGSGLEERLYALKDANYNTSALVSAAGSVVERLIEDPYGVATFLNPTTWAPLAGSNYAWAHTHQGGWLDASSGLLHYRNRMYSPTLGRWMQQDPMGYVDGMNLYQAYRSGPVALVDPLGTDAYVDEGSGHAGILVDVKDQVGCVIAVLRGDFRAMKKRRGDLLTEAWRFIQLMTYTQGQVDLTVMHPKNAFFKQRIKGTQAQDNALVNWLLKVGGQDGNWLLNAILGIGPTASSFYPTSGKYERYAFLTQACTDFVDDALDVYLGYNWFMEPFFTGPQDLLQQLQERFNKDGTKKEYIDDGSGYTPGGGWV